MNNFNAIYETMLGFLEPEACVPGIENAFAEGSFCDREYEKMRAAYMRICSRLGAAEEDPDLNAMVESMERIQKDLCRRIYEIKFSTDV